MLALATAAIMATATPALPAPYAVHESCVRHQVHTPAGKTSLQRHVYFCDTKAATKHANSHARRDAAKMLRRW